MEHMERKKLSAFLDGEGSEEERAEIGEHLRTCSRCAREAEELSQVSELFASVEDVEVSPYFLTRLRRRIAEGESKTAIRLSFVEWIRNLGLGRMAIPVGVAASLFFAVVAGSNLGRAIYRTGMGKEIQASQELTDVFSVTFLDEYPEGSLSSAYNELLIGEGE